MSYIRRDMRNIRTMGLVCPDGRKSYHVLFSGHKDRMR